VIVHPRARQESRISEGGVTMQKRTEDMKKIVGLPAITAKLKSDSMCAYTVN
jgi:hypothetical protein